MAWTKTELIADLGTVYEAVGTPQLVETDIDKDIKTYIVNVFEAGKSEKGEKPLGYKKNLHFYIHKEGDPAESAFYQMDEPKNSVEKEVSTLVQDITPIGNLYNSAVLRTMILGAIVKAANAIINEDPGTTDHSMRLKLANSAIEDSNKYVNAFMVMVANNATVQTQGGKVIDSDLEWICNSSIKTIATVFGFTN